MGNAWFWPPTPLATAVWHWGGPLGRTDAGDAHTTPPHITVFPGVRVPCRLPTLGWHMASAISHLFGSLLHAKSAVLAPIYIAETRFFDLFSTKISLENPKTP